VVFATSGVGCEAECPNEVISIDETGKVKYYGIRYTDSIGYFIGKIEKVTLDSINQNFIHILETGIDTLKGQRTDHPIFEIYIQASENSFNKTINAGKISDEDSKIIRWFRDIKKQVKLQRTKDTLSFETTTQNFEISLLKAK